MCCKQTLQIPRKSRVAGKSFNDDDIVKITHCKQYEKI